MAWRRGHVIGQGSSATVYIAQELNSGEHFAVKSTQLSRSATLQKEQALLSQLNSPYIVKYVGHGVTVEKNEEPIYNLVMSHAPGGSLHDLIKKRGSSLNEGEIQFYTRQILLGLDYLHRRGIVHRDVKSRNVLIGLHGGAWLSDFGSSESEFLGTANFMAPEAARGDCQGLESDVWALGCTVLEMANGLGAWRLSDNFVSVLYRIGYSDDTPEVPSWMSENGKDFLGKCFRRERLERWTVKELLEHPFCNGSSDTDSWDSPTAVLDRVLWESSKGSSSETETDLDLDLDLDRILYGSGSLDERVRSLSSSGPSWDMDEEGWAAVKDFKRNYGGSDVNIGKLHIPFNICTS